MRGTRKTYDDDDGRTIADMNVEGLPWYDDRRNRDRAAAPSGGGEDLDAKGRTRALLGVLAAALLVAAVFAGAFFLVILLMRLAGS